MSQMGTRQPPRFVPTLTDVVAPEQVVQTGVDLPSVSFEETCQPMAKGQFQYLQQQDGLLLAAGSRGAQSQGLEALAQSMQARVMARVDASLEERLRYALADMVQMHSQSLYQALRVDVERLVSAAVHEAIAQELANMRKPDSI